MNNGRTPVLLIDDDEVIRSGRTQALECAGFEVKQVDSAEKALPFISKNFPGIVISEVRLPKQDGLALLRDILSIDKTLPVVLITGFGDIGTAVTAMRLGAFDFIPKPVTSAQLVDVAQRAALERAATMTARANGLLKPAGDDPKHQMLGESREIGAVRDQLARLASTQVNVLIVGETGAGKEVAARMLHRLSRRRNGKFVAINCGGVPETLMESELFGHEAGAFTGASKRRIGRIEEASGGTLFLDEIESMPLTLQIRLLRVLQERRVERLGSNEEIPVDFRIVAASKADLKQLSEAEKFRIDLYYRLNVAVVRLPSLRSRSDDILPLFNHFVAQVAEVEQVKAPELTHAMSAELLKHDWPGNIRELRNAAECFALDLPNSLWDDLQNDEAQRASLIEQVESFEKALIEQELRLQRGHASLVSQVLGVPRKTLYDKIHKYGIEPKRFRTVC